MRPGRVDYESMNCKVRNVSGDSTHTHQPRARLEVQSETKLEHTSNIKLNKIFHKAEKKVKISSDFPNTILKIKFAFYHISIICKKVSKLI